MSLQEEMASVERERESRQRPVERVKFEVAAERLQISVADLKALSSRRAFSLAGNSLKASDLEQLTAEFEAERAARAGPAVAVPARPVAPLLTPVPAAAAPPARSAAELQAEEERAIIARILLNAAQATGA